MVESGNLKIVEVKISELKPAGYNPRKLTSDQKENLRDSLTKYGFIDPIVVNGYPRRRNVVIGGHQRLQIASEMGLESVPVVYVNLDEKNERELNLRLNKNLGEWDYNLLANFDEELLKDVGFTSEDLDKMFDLKEDEFDADKEYESIIEPQTKLGDLYQLGNHRLLCGDSTLKESFEKLIGDEKAQIVFTDPPFNVNYNYWGFRQGKKEKYKRKKIIGKAVFNDKQKPEEYQKFIEDFMGNCFNYSKDDASFYCYYGSRNENIVRNGIEKAKWFISQTLIWLKPSLVISPGQDYHRIYEPCYFGWKYKKKHFINKKWGYKLSELIILDQNDFEEYLNVLYEKRDVATMNYIHPTQKPVRLAERALRRHSNRDDIVLEPFNGSGSTMIACEQLDRKCYAIELDPKFVDVAIKRWELFTNKKAIKL